MHRHSKSHAAEVIFKPDGNELALSIRDFGIGIAPEMLEKFRAAGLFGVGLAGIRERVRELGGAFAIDSDGQGTLLRVTIPSAHPVTEAAEPQSRASSSGLSS
jgi:signal transduction histidine kinase